LENTEKGKLERQMSLPYSFISLLPHYYSAGYRKVLEGSKKASDQHWSIILLAILASLRNCSTLLSLIFYSGI
jgi:undecaprenyl pyrophosphate phosphatase UppP